MTGRLAALDTLLSALLVIAFCSSALATSRSGQEPAATPLAASVSVLVPTVPASTPAPRGPAGPVEGASLVPTGTPAVGQGRWPFVFVAWGKAWRCVTASSCHRYALPLGPQEWRLIP